MRCSKSAGQVFQLWGPPYTCRLDVTNLPERVTGEMMQVYAGSVCQRVTRGKLTMHRAGWYTIVGVVVVLSLLASAACGRGDNGFDLAGSLVPEEEIHLGGPPRDGIPSIDRPVFVRAGDADFLADADRILGLVRGGRVKAYPIAIMNWHEVVNDRLGGESVAITYCPLCGTGVAFVSNRDGRQLSFGVSGLLYNSDVLLYDRETESLWSQLRMQAVAGPLKGERLTALPLTHTSWRAWRQAHPETLVLSTETGFDRDYRRDPYTGYAENSDLYFPVSAKSRRYHAKERVLGVEMDGRFKAYPFAELSRTGQREIRDTFAGRPLRIRFDQSAESARVFDEDGTELAAVTGFWFAWYAFHPTTEVFTVGR